MRLLWVFVPLLACLTGVVEIVSAAPALGDEYFHSYTNAVEYIAWTDDGRGHLSGQYEETIIDSTDPTKLDNINAAFTGIRNGSDVSLSFALLSTMAGATWTGHIGWRALTLVRPTSNGSAETTFSAGSFENYKSAANHLTDLVNNAAAAQAQAAENRAILQRYADLSQKLLGATTDISGTISGLTKAMPVQPSAGGLRDRLSQQLAKMTADWSQEQADANSSPLSCVQKGKVEVDAGTVQVDMGQVEVIEGDASTFHDNAIQSIEAITTDLELVAKVGPQFDALSPQYAEIEGTVQPPSYMKGTYPSYRATTLKQQAQLRTRFGAVWSSIQNYVQRARSLNDRATQFPSTLTCSG